ncbi:MAG: hypothetical protein Ct9H300mP12_02560 [Acidimicrobiales bacterium]|nr:MAG: hypothetical protein Ct9H300mP12_02560 [Acidimicrobiales bacterium]
MTRTVTIGAAQVGPIQLADTRSAVVERLISLLRQGADAEWTWSSSPSSP